MRRPRRQFLRLAAGAAALPLMAWTARAQSYPSRPITMVVPFPPGGPTDTIARILVERMRVSLGQPVIIENVGGAGGSIGVGRVARAMPDGYTIGIGNSSSHVFNGALYALPYDLLADFEPVALLSAQPAVIVAQERPAGRKPDRVHRLAEGQSRQGVAREVRASARHPMCGGRSSRSRPARAFSS